MTMNDHWGYNKNDKNFKSTKEILRMLVDIASKGGNYLLNIGPTAAGVFPPESVERLQQIGEWMKVNGESIYGTSTSPFRKLSWGRCTQKSINGNTRLYLHIFDQPKNGELVVPGIFNNPLKSYMLADKNQTVLDVETKGASIIIKVPSPLPDTINTVVVLDVEGKTDVNNPPTYIYDNNIFIDSTLVTIISDRENVEMHYTLDGTIPSINSPIVNSPIKLIKTSVVSAQCFRNGKAVSDTSSVKLNKVIPLPAKELNNPQQGIRYKYFEGDWAKIPEFDSVKVVDKGVIPTFSIDSKKKPDSFGFEFSGFVKVPVTGVYTFFTNSDDGSNLSIDGKLVVDNDFAHGNVEKNGSIALTQGYHAIMVRYFENSGGEILSVYFKGPGIEKQDILVSSLFHD